LATSDEKFLIISLVGGRYLFGSFSIYLTRSISCYGLKACWLAYPSSFDLVTPLHLLPNVDLSTPCLSTISFHVNCSPSSHDFESAIVSSMGAIVVDLLRVGVGKSRRVMVFGGACMSRTATVILGIASNVTTDLRRNRAFRAILAEKIY
jgi:hypothetical protein